MFFVCALVVTLHSAAGSYFMYRKSPLKGYSLAAELFARSPKKSRPFVFRKTYTPRAVIQGMEFMKRLPPLDLKTRPPVSFDLKLDDFIAESERRIHEELAATRIMDLKDFRTPEPGATDEVRSLEKSMSIISRTRILGQTTRITVVRGQYMNPPERSLRALDRLAEAAGRYTGYEIKTSGPVPLAEKELAGVNFILFSSDEQCELTGAEQNALVRYLLEGGFVWVDGGSSGHAKSGFMAALEYIARTRSESPVRISPIPAEHLIYTCFFVFPDGFLQNAGASTVRRLDGIWAGDRLAGVIADRDFATLWSDAVADDRNLAFGVNLVVFALASRSGPQNDVSNPRNR
jgi:hypothetical protein